MTYFMNKRDGVFLCGQTTRVECYFNRLALSISVERWSQTTVVLWVFIHIDVELVKFIIVSRKMLWKWIHYFRFIVMVQLYRSFGINYIQQLIKCLEKKSLIISYTFYKPFNVMLCAIGVTKQVKRG